MLLVLITGLAFGVRLALLASSPDPLGTDGYYYVVQIEDWVARGRLHVPDASWVFWPLAGIHALGAGPVFAVKLGAVLLATACVPLAWFAGRALDRVGVAASGPCAPAGAGPAWALAFWAAASPSLTHLAVDFPKNLGLLAPGLACLVLVSGQRPTLARYRALHWAALAACGLLMASAHRLGAALLLLAGLGAGLGWLLGARRTKLRSGPDWLALGVLGGGCLVFGIGSLVLPGLLHPGDLDRLSGQWTASPWPPPPFWWFGLRPTHPVQQVELGLTWAAFGLGVWAWLRAPTRRPVLTALLLMLLACLFPFFDRGSLDLGYRLSLMAPMVAAPLAVCAASILLKAARPWPIWALAGVGLLATPLARHGADPANRPPWQEYRRLIGRIPRPLPALLIVHAPISFQYDHQTGEEAMAWAPEPELDRTRIGRLVWGIRDGEWLAYARPGDPSPIRLDQDYVFAREDAWERLVAGAEADGDQELLERIADPRNPARVRPVGLLRNRDQDQP